MNNIPTAEESLIIACIEAGFTEDYAKMIFKINPDTSNAFIKAIINFSKIHVETALKEASEKAELDLSDDYKGCEISKSSILNCYPEENIK